MPEREILPQDIAKDIIQLPGMSLQVFLAEGAFENTGVIGA